MYVKSLSIAHIGYGFKCYEKGQHVFAFHIRTLEANTRWALPSPL